MSSLENFNSLFYCSTCLDIHTTWRGNLWRLSVCVAGLRHKHFYYNYLILCSTEREELSNFIIVESFRAITFFISNVFPPLLLSPYDRSELFHSPCALQAWTEHNWNPRVSSRQSEKSEKIWNLKMQTVLTRHHVYSDSLDETQRLIGICQLFHNLHWHFHIEYTSTSERESCIMKWSCLAACWTLKFSPSTVSRRSLLKFYSMWHWHEWRWYVLYMSVGRGRGEWARSVRIVSFFQTNEGWYWNESSSVWDEASKRSKSNAITLNKNEKQQKKKDSANFRNFLSSLVLRVDLHHRYVDVSLLLSEIICGLRKFMISFLYI